MSTASGRDRFEIDPPPHADPRPPRSFRLPEGAVDTHAHVIGSSYIEARSYTPTPAPESAYLRMLDAVGMSHGVLIQVSVHGTDNSLLLRTLRAHPKRLRGIAVAPHDLPDAGWRELKEAGVVGLRLNTTSGGGVGIGQLENYEAVCRDHGWHLQLLVDPDLIVPLAPKIARLQVPVVFDHMGYVRPEPGMEEAGQTLIGLMHDGAWVKVSGAFRLSRTGPPYADTVPFASALIEAAPDRCVWGSDWPHVSFRGQMPDPGDLLDLLHRCAPDPHQLRAILVDNPQRLYGFASVPLRRD
jgi:predicted TIM-barrel fold metal-dependent hydrolase